MTPSFQPFQMICISIIIFQCIINAQEEMFYTDDFSTQSDWIITKYGYGGSSFPPVWQSNDPKCDLIGDDGNCVSVIADGHISRTISTSNYRNIRLEIGVTIDAVENAEFCWLQYRTNTTAWSDVTTLLQVNDPPTPHVIVNLTIAFNDQSTFQVRLGTEGDSNNDICYFDNLNMYGIALPSQPTTASPTTTSPTTTSPTTESPTTSPPTTNPPTTDSPTTSSPTTNSPTTNSPTSNPTNDPISEPTSDPTNDPTYYPTTEPTYYPTKSPLEPIELTANTAPTTSTPTVGSTKTDLSDTLPALKEDPDDEPKDESNDGLPTELMIGIIVGIICIICLGIGLLYAYHKRSKHTDSKHKPKQITIVVNGDDDYKLPKKMKKPTFDTVASNSNQRDTPLPTTPIYSKNGKLSIEMQHSHNIETNNNDNNGDITPLSAQNGSETDDDGLHDDEEKTGMIDDDHVTPGYDDGVITGLVMDTNPAQNGNDGTKTNKNYGLMLTDDAIVQNMVMSDILDEMEGDKGLKSMDMDQNKLASHFKKGGPELNGNYDSDNDDEYVDNMNVYRRDNMGRTINDDVVVKEMVIDDINSGNDDDDNDNDDEDDESDDILLDGIQTIQ